MVLRELLERASHNLTGTTISQSGRVVTYHVMVSYVQISLTRTPQLIMNMELLTVRINNARTPSAIEQTNTVLSPPKSSKQDKFHTPMLGGNEKRVSRIN